jgi:signal transduction histidine kinase
MPTILVVDDYSSNRKLIATLLGHEGHRVLEAKDGVEGLHTVQSEKTDLIIADILMPTMNGFEFVLRLRQDRRTALIPVIFYSATLLEGEVQLVARACGVSKVLAKPSETEEILRIVNEALASPQRDETPALPDRADGIDIVQVLNNKLYEKNKELLELTAQLEQRVAERTSDLEIANRHLQEQILEREKAQSELRQVQRLEAIGRLAGGVAHDFNNLLAVIIGCSDVVLDALAPDHPAARKVEMIRQAGTSAADLTHQLLAFSRQQMLQPRLLNLKEVVEKVRAMLHRLIGENIELKVSVQASLGHVKADPGQIEQILINLAVNARDAMPQGGQLTVEVRNVELDESYKHEHESVIPGRYVMLAVEDTGCGMDRDTQSRIFDPFFTTKELGKGTGLGLATVYGIVKQSGGYIWVRSELRKGTKFQVYLPRVEQAAQPAKEEESEGTVLRGRETILLAEDSASLREMAREYLEGVGYTVLETSSGEEALQRAKEFTGPIHLLLTDVVMTGMSGPELARQMESLRPGMRVIFTSGYTDAAIGRQGVLDPAVAFIQKPYRPKVLARKIREVLGSPDLEVEHHNAVSE